MKRPLSSLSNAAISVGLMFLSASCVPKKVSKEVQYNFNFTDVQIGCQAQAACDPSTLKGFRVDTPLYFSSNASENPEINPEVSSYFNALRSLPSSYSLNSFEELELINGGDRKAYQQLINGIPVENGRVEIKTDSFTNLSILQGSYFAGLSNWEQSDIKEGKLSISALPLLPSNATEFEVPREEELRDIALSAYFDDAKKAASTAKDFETRKIYRSIGDELRLHEIISFTYFQDDGPRRPAVIIDLETSSVSEILETSFNVISRGIGGNKNTGEYIYSDDADLSENPPALTGLHLDGICVLDANTHRTVDLRNKKDTPSKSSPSIEVSCDRADYKAVKGAFSPSNDAHGFVSLTLEMFQEWYGVSDVTHDKLIIGVHYGKKSNAARFFKNYIVFGDGKNGFYPRTTMDVVAHEVGHSFTRFNKPILGVSRDSNVYNEFSAINESFSDMTAIALNQYAREKYEFGSEEENYRIGLNLDYKNERYIRDMCRPRKVQHTSQLKDNSFSSHEMAGLYNQVFCVLSKKPNWGIKKAYAVFMQANRNDWNGNSSFLEASVAVRKVVLGPGYDISDVSDIEDAFSKIGINANSGTYIENAEGAEVFDEAVPLDIYYSTSKRLILSSNDKVCEYEDRECFQEKCKLEIDISSDLENSFCLGASEKFLCVLSCKGTYQLIK